jgi:hypothetical protein
MLATSRIKLTAQRTFFTQWVDGGMSDTAVVDTTSGSAAVDNASQIELISEILQAPITLEIAIGGKILQQLNNFKDSWDLYDKTDIPMFWHIPKAGGSSIMVAMGGWADVVVSSRPQNLVLPIDTFKSE